MSKGKEIDLTDTVGTKSICGVGGKSSDEDKVQTLNALVMELRHVIIPVLTRLSPGSSFTPTCKSLCYDGT